MLKEFVQYADNMRARVRLGSVLASCAVLVTIVAVVAIAVDSAAAGDDTARAVWLTPEAAAALPACVSSGRSRAAASRSRRR